MGNVSTEKKKQNSLRFFYLTCNILQLYLNKIYVTYVHPLNNTRTHTLKQRIMFQKMSKLTKFLKQKEKQMRNDKTIPAFYCVILKTKNIKV